MMKEELEKRLHDIAELLYEDGFADGKTKGFEDAQQLKMSGMYEQGLKDAWECMRKILLSPAEGGIRAGDLYKVFGTQIAIEILGTVSVDEAMQKIKEYEERQKQEEKRDIKAEYEKYYMPIGNENMRRKREQREQGEKSCRECMDFPTNFEEFAKEYGFTDKEEYYTNGSELIPVFRVKQWLEHLNVQAETPLCTYTDSEVAKSFIEDVSAVEELLPKQTDATDSEIKVGDEVICYGTTTRKVVLEVIETSSMSGNDSSNKHKKYRCLGETGISTESDGLCEPKKTGRHFPQIAEVLKQLRGEEVVIMQTR